MIAEFNSRLYQKACSYAYHINSTLYKDIIHDAYIRWFDKTGKNLFDEHERVVMSVIKKTWWSKYIQPSQYMKKGVIRYREHVSFNDYDSYTSLTPEDICIANDLEEKIITLCTDVQLEIYLLAVQGYSQLEIAKILDQTPQNINYYFKRIRSWASHFN